ncbi:MAG: hypothetical protein ACFE8N_02180 [Promethearchaeota archaeon]
MSEAGINIFKLNFDGSFDEIAYVNIKEIFTIINILAIYLSKKKIMYIWIGRNSTQALKNHISNIRVLIKEEFPNFRILRNFTFEMREEPFEFFKNLNIAKEELYKQIDYQEEIMLPTLREIDSLKKEFDQSIEMEKFSDAINISKGIIELAKKIEDEALITEYEKSIVDLTNKNENKKLVEQIEEKARQIEIEFSRLINANEFLKARQLIENFEKEYKDKYDLSQIPSVYEIILKEKDICEKEQKRLEKELIKLENDLIIALKNLEIEIATELIEKGKTLFVNLINDEIKSKWKGFEIELQNARKKSDLTRKVEDFIKNSKSSTDNFQFQILNDELEILLTEVQKFKIVSLLEKLEDLREDLIKVENSYKNKLIELEELEKLIKSKQESYLLEEIVELSEKIITVAKSINKLDYIQKYSKVIKETKNKIEKNKIFEENQKQLKDKLIELEIDFKNLLERMKLNEVERVIEKSKIYLIEILDGNIKKRWNSHEENYMITKNLINTVETLSKKCLDALDRRSYVESLKFNEQIIHQIEKYNIGEAMKG